MDMVQLSRRLQAVAGLAGDCGTVADVGTDHGYIPVYLVLSQQAKRAIAMDINQGPLLRAREHIRQYGLEGRVEARLSDGCLALKPGEADVIVVAGMGGALMQRILVQGREAAQAAKRLVLQPQSELAAFRMFLWNHGYQIVAEDMVLEDGKYYPILASSYQGGGCGAGSGSPHGEGRQAPSLEDKFGPLLLAQGHPVLKQFLLRQKQQKQKILAQLRENSRQDATKRADEIIRELEDIDAALRRYPQVGQGKGAVI